MASDVTKDISSVVWIGVLGLLFLAVAMYEGWFSSTPVAAIQNYGSQDANPSGTQNQNIPGTDIQCNWFNKFLLFGNPCNVGASTSSTSNADAYDPTTGDLYGG
jgi:hypothetical protein